MVENGRARIGRRLGTLLEVGPESNSARPDWRTPPTLLAQIQERYGAPLFDPCPYPRPSWDGLKIPWKTRNFVNPPYGRGIHKWFEKAIEEISNERAGLAVFLVHARTDTEWYHEYVLGGAQEIWYLKKRVRFTHSTGKATSSPFPSIIVAFYSEAYAPVQNAAFSGSWVLEREDSRTLDRFNSEPSKKSPRDPR